MSVRLNVISPPEPHSLPAEVADFLRLLATPTAFRIPGRDRSRCRAYVTLLHGNEPSGTIGLLRWLREGVVPATDLLCIVGAVPTALAAPLLSHRVLPHARDLNRCFLEPFEGNDGLLAREILELVREAKPEALVDVHNTSGRGPAYGVLTQLDEPRLALTQSFATHAIVTHLRLATLIEVLEGETPAIAIECGGASDARANEVAYAGLNNLASREDLFAADASGVHVMLNPVRVELVDDAQLAYAASPSRDVDVTVIPDVDRHNFGILPVGETLGWLGARGLAALKAVDASGHDQIEHLFEVSGGELVTARTLRLFMATTDARIARQDCLFYAVATEMG